jgi:nucleoside-diphosphate-sugar epimerase
MKILLIGGTGIISTAVTRQLSAENHKLYLINRGTRTEVIPPNVQLIKADIHDTDEIAHQLAGESFDAVADFISFTPEDIERSFHLFAGRTRQYIFISSGAAFQKPLSDYRVTESTPLRNPYWKYAGNKILCEDTLIHFYRKYNFPITIVRPGHTYDERWVPLGLSGEKGCWQVMKRMLEGKPTIIHGDGTSLWTLTHSSDFAAGFCGLIGNPHAIGETVNISSDEVMTWNQIYECIADALGVTLNPFYVSSMFLQCSSDYDFKSCLIGERAHSTVFVNDKLKKLVPGYCAKIRFSEGIKRTINNILSTSELQVEDPKYDAYCDMLVEQLSHTAAVIKENLKSFHNGR